MAKKQVMSRSGHKFKVDISDEACGRLSDGEFKHGDRILSNNSDRKGVIMGVAGMSEWIGQGEKVLWIALDGDEGKVCYGYKGEILPLK